VQILLFISFVAYFWKFSCFSNLELSRTGKKTGLLNDTREEG